MTQDQRDPTPQTAGSTDSTSASGAANSTDSTSSANGANGIAPKAATSRPTRRRHTSSRSRQPKDQKDQKETATHQGDQPAAAAAEAPAAQEAPAVELAAQAPSAAPAATTPPEATEKPQRAPARTRRGGGSRRRNSKAETPAVQLVPIVSTTEPAASDTVGGTSSAESPAESLPAPELLPLDKAILAHLDALSQAVGQPADESAAQPASAEEQPSAATEQESATATQEETPPSPQRRYRFDRPRTSATAPAPRPERLSGWRATPPTLMTPAPEAETTVEREESQSVADIVSAETAEPVATVEGVEAEEQEIVTTPPSAIEVIEEQQAPVPEEHEATAEVAEVAEVAEEEQAETEKTARHRRRRGRSRTGRAQEAETETGEVEGAAPPARRATPYAAPESTVTYAHEYDTGNGYMRGIEAEVGYEETGYGPYTPSPRARAARPSVPATRPQESPWSITNAQQQVQEPESPFASPEPSFARGFGPQSAGVASPLHEPAPRIRRGERGTEVPPMSANQLGAVLTNAIAQQTDRLLNELRRQQYPPSMTVALPAFPTTERIGVFVDVANLLYSARSQRMSIDFGRLLDFLRGNRRLIRAHAYAPTNPDPHAEQTFLSAVKGVGYRITTKNYKTFASGARKADMDLDLCMDIVRMVDAGAIDTVVLVSGDSDFLPLLEYCSDHGVRVEVAAFDDAAAMILRQSCDLFINLSQVEEIRA